MSSLTDNEWMLLNEVTYKIHTTDDSARMRLQFLKLLRMLIPYKYGTFYLASRDQTHDLSDPVAVNIPQEKLKEYDEYKDVDYTRWMFATEKNIVYRESDLFTNTEREKMTFYHDFYVHHDIHYSVVLSLAFHETFLGVVSLYRSRNETDFSEKDLFILNQVKEHLAYRLFTMHEIEVSSVSASEKKIPAALKQVNCDLTNREIEVFLLVLKGFSNNDIAERLFISEHTVKKHLKNLYKKLHVKSRIQLMQFQAAPAAVWQKS